MDSGTLIDNIRKSVNMAAEAWAQDKTSLAHAVREANNRTGEVLELREQLAAMRAVGERQVAEIEQLKAQARRYKKEYYTALGEAQALRAETTPQPADVATSGPDAEAKAAGAREVYMRAAVPGPPPVPFDKLKPHCRDGWHAVVAFVEHPLLIENGVLRDRIEARDAALKVAVDTLIHAGYEYNPEAMVPWKPPVNEAARKLHALDPYSLTEMATAAAKYSGRRMTPVWWIDTVASIRAWVMGEMPLTGWSPVDSEEDGGDDYIDWDWDGDEDDDCGEVVEAAPGKTRKVPPPPKPVAETPPKPDIIENRLERATKEVATKMAGIVNDLRMGMENKRKKDDFNED